MSNKRKLKPPPGGFDFRRFAKIILDSDLDDDVKEQILLRAAFADKKGRLPDERHPQVR